MNIGSWLLIATVPWLAGFFSMWSLDPAPGDKLVYVPKWMFILFGKPKHKNVPITVQSAYGVYLQITGLALAVYGVLLNVCPVIDPQLSVPIGIVLNMLIGGFISRWLARKQPYRLQSNKTNDDEP
jgi:hypothetical protein